MRPLRILGVVAALGTAGAAMIWALLPEPVLVDLATVTRGPLDVTVGAEGVTRVQDPRTVFAPIAGTVLRPPVQVGDRVVRGETVVAVIQPAEPAFLDARARAQAEAAVAEAEAAVRLAEANLERARTELAHAEVQNARNRELAARGIIPQRMMEDSAALAATLASAVEAAEFELALHRASLVRSQAVLRGPEAAASGEAPESECCVRLRAPVDGIVLRIEQEEAGLVQAGTPLLTVGDPERLQIEADVLSTDAVRLQVGARAHVERWGGAAVLEARVVRVDPSGFTRVSALGIEEQRVRVLLDIVSPPEARAGLGDRFRVFVRLVVLSAEDALRVPRSALFRTADGWAVFRAIDGRAVETPVEIGPANDSDAAITRGLSEGERVVLFPGSRVEDGTRIAPRP